MSEQNVIHGDDLPLTDELVEQYLQSNPEFFERNPSLLTQLRLVDSQRGTVSLVERQQQQLRQKVHGLEEEITQLMAMANHNERLFNVFSQIYLSLLESESLSQLLDQLTQATVADLSLAEMKLWLKNPQDLTHSCMIEEDCSELMQARLEKEDYYFGRLQQSEQEMLFADVSSGSVVMVKLAYNNQALGFLAFRSEDAEHFDPRMDTLLLNQFKMLVGKLIAQYL